jgi:glycine cleavage system H protein
MNDTVNIGKCVIRTDLHYLVDSHCWVRFNDDGTLTVGITDVAQNMAGPVLHVYIRKKGMRQKGQNLATIESSKWVGPLKAPVSGEIVEANLALEKDPGLVNRSPYGDGWVMRIKPLKLEEERGALLSGAEAVEAYRRKIEEQSVKACAEVAECEPK